MTSSGPPAPANTAHLELTGKFADSTSWSVGWDFYFPFGLEVDYSTLTALMGDLAGHGQDLVAACGADEVTIDTCRLLATGVSVSLGVQAFLFGQGSRGFGVPSAIAVPVREIVLAKGRGRGGRFWLPNPAASDQEFGWQLTPGAHSHYSDALAAFLDGVNGVSGPGFSKTELVVLHRRENGHYLAAAQIQPVDALVLSKRLGTQDRRMSTVRVP